MTTRGEVPLEKAKASPKPSTAPAAHISEDHMTTRGEVPMEKAKPSPKPSTVEAAHISEDHMTAKGEVPLEKAKPSPKPSTAPAVEAAHISEDHMMEKAKPSPKPSTAPAVEAAHISETATFVAIFPVQRSRRLSGFIAGSGGQRKLELNENKRILITEKIKQPNSEGEEIHKEEAICRFCFKKFQDDNVLKTKCKCKFTLIHEPCAAEWSQQKGNNKCDSCAQDIQNIPVTLSEHHSLGTNKKDKSKRLGCFGSEGSLSGKS